MSKKVKQRAILVAGKHDYNPPYKYGGRWYTVYSFNERGGIREYLFHIGTKKYKYDAGSIVIAEEKLWPTAKRSKRVSPHKYWQIVET
jgi:hypothetical protein